MHNRDLVSVIVPVFNGERYLAAALASIAAQDYRPLYVLIVDDGSTDHTEEIASEFLRQGGLDGEYIYQPNQGPAAARNCGLSRAPGAWIAFLDADDLWLPAKTSLQRKVFDLHPTADVIWGAGVVFAGEGLPDTSAPRPSSPLILLQSMLFRRSILEQIGHFDPKLKYGEDVDWLLRARERAAQLVLHPEPVVYYRRHTANLTNDVARTRMAFHVVLKRSLDRRRLGATSIGNLPSLVSIPSAHQHDQLALNAGT